MHISWDNMHTLVNMYVPWSAIRRSSNHTIWPFDPHEPPQQCLGESPHHKSPLSPHVTSLLFLLPLIFCCVCLYELETHGALGGSHLRLCVLDLQCPLTS